MHQSIYIVCICVKLHRYSSNIHALISLLVLHEAVSLWYCVERMNFDEPAFQV